MKLEIRMPEMGDDKDIEASVSFWYFDTGEKVGEGDDLLELVTDKATFNVPAPSGGTLVEISVEEGDLVKSGDLLGTIETEG